MSVPELLIRFCSLLTVLGAVFYVLSSKFPSIPENISLALVWFGVVCMGFVAVDTIAEFSAWIYGLFK